MNLPGIWLFSGFGLSLNDAALAPENSSLGLWGSFQLSVWVAHGHRHGIWRLVEAHHFLVLVQLPPWPGPTRSDSAEEKSTCIETEEQIAAEGED